MVSQIITQLSTNQNNALKFFISGILLYPLLETFVDNMISRMVTLAVMRGDNVHVRSTRLGSFGLNTVYWGRKRWRMLILLVGLLYNVLALAGEYGFGSKQIDLSRVAFFQKRRLMQDPQFRDLTSLDVQQHAPLISAGYLGCIAQDPDISIQPTRYPAQFAQGSRADQLRWCTKAKSLVYTKKYRKFKKSEFARHCKELHIERIGDYDLILNGSFQVRPMLARRNPHQAWKLACEANQVHSFSVNGFAVGGLSLSGNRHHLQFDMFGLKPKFALALHSIPVQSMSTSISAHRAYFEGARYLAHPQGHIACVELQNESRLLCLVDDFRRNQKINSLAMLNLTEWYVVTGKTNSSTIRSQYEIRPSGLIMHLSITSSVKQTMTETRAVDGYRKLLALYDIMHLPGILTLHSFKKHRYTRSTTYSLETTINIARIILYRMTASKVLLNLDYDSALEEALEKTGSREVATMSRWAILFYLIPVIALACLFCANLVLARRIRIRAKKLQVPDPLKSVTQYRPAAIILPNMAVDSDLQRQNPKAPVPVQLIQNEDIVEALAYSEHPLIGLVDDGIQKRITFVSKTRYRLKKSTSF